MTKEPLVTHGIKDQRMLAAIRAIASHFCVEENYLEYAYLDHLLPSDEGQTIPHLCTLALISEALALTGRMEVLKVRTGSGYQSTDLARLAREKISLEKFP